MKAKNIKASLDTGAKLESMNYNFLQGEKGHELEFNILSCGNSIELEATDTAELFITFPDNSVLKEDAIVDDTNNVVKYTMADNMTSISGSIKLQVQILNDSGDIVLYTQPTTYTVNPNVAYTGGTPITNVPNLKSMSDDIADVKKSITTLHAEVDKKLSPDGAIPMDTGYVPINNQQIATKKYVDDHAGSGTGGGSGLTPADQEKIDHISITQDVDLDVLESDQKAILDRVDGIDYDTTLGVTKVAHNIVLENDQADVVDITIQGGELASTKRVDDMIKAIPTINPIVIGDGVGEAYEGSKGKALEDDIALIKSDYTKEFEVIPLDFVGNIPTSSECLQAFKLLSGFDYTKNITFKIMDNTNDKFATVDYIGSPTATESSAGTFYPTVIDKAV